MRRFVGLLFVFAGALNGQQATLSAGQAATAQTAPGTVTGRVFCEDTGQPARFASVQLVSDHPAPNPMFDSSTPGKNPDFEKTMLKAMASIMKGNNLTTLTGLDGTFSLDKVPPGTYWVLAQLAGYQSPLRQFSALEMFKADGAALEAIESFSPKVVVQSGQSVHADVELERGSAISGTIHYDDGSPAPGVTPVLMAQGKDGKWKELSGTGGMLPVSTDDRGHYRICGMGAGKYAVKATLPTMQAMTGLGATGSMHMSLADALIVYSGGAMREKDLKPVEVGPGADVDGVDVIFPIDDLHVIAGTVVAKSDGHAVDSGTVLLEDPDTKAMLRTMSINPDGSFRLNYVPEGQYLLKITGASDTDSAGNSDSGNDLLRMMHSKVLKSYGDAEQPVTVKNDAAGLVLQVPEQAATPTTVPKPPAPPAAPAAAATGTP